MSNKAWKKALVHKNLKIKDVIDNINKNPYHITLIVDSQNKLIGTITDGDIRRSLLNGMNLESTIGKVYNKNPIVGTSSMNEKTIKGIMEVNEISQLPLVDEQKKVTGIYSLLSLQKKNRVSNNFVIMAGGLGSRLLPLTKKKPKPLLKVMGKPMIEHIILRARQSGFFNFLISVNYLGEMIIDHLGDGKNLGIKIQYIREESPLGTAGALSLIKNKAIKEAFVVSNCDVLTDIDYKKLLDFHVENKLDATMAVRTHEYQNPYGVIKTDGEKIIDFSEKPVVQEFINAGIYVLSPNILSLIKKNEYLDMSTLFKNLKKNNNKIFVYPTHESWADIGNLDEFNKITQNK